MKALPFLVASTVFFFVAVIPEEPWLVAVGGVYLLLIAVFVTCLLSIVPFPKLSRWRRRETLMAGVWASLGVSMLFTQWPLRTAYFFSRPAMEEAVAVLKAGKPLPLPRRVGWFTIRGTEVVKTNGQVVVCLWTEPNPSWRHGFVLFPFTASKDADVSLSFPVQAWDDRWKLVLDD